MTVDGGFYFCYFERGFEQDLFIERESGQHALENMSITMFNLDQKVRSFVISRYNHLFVECDALLYRSKDNLKDLMA